MEHSMERPMEHSMERPMKHSMERPMEHSTERSVNPSTEHPAERSTEHETAEEESGQASQSNQTMSGERPRPEAAEAEGEKQLPSKGRGAAARLTRDMDELRSIFRQADVDGSDFLDFDELLALGRAVNAKFTPDLCMALLKVLDTDHDSKVSEQEFVVLVRDYLKFP